MWTSPSTAPLLILEGTEPDAHQDIHIRIMFQGKHPRSSLICVGGSIGAGQYDLNNHGKTRLCFERSVHIPPRGVIGGVCHMVGTAATGSRKTQRLILAVLFAVLVFMSKTLLPTPLDKMLVVIQALFLGLGAITLSPFGATVVSAIAGLLTSAWRAPFAPFTLGFAVLYGLLVDAFSLLFKVRAGNGAVRMKRLVAGVTLATAVTGMASYYTTVYVLSLLPRNIVLETSILVVGVINGLAGGYLAGILWSKTLRHLLS